MSFGILFGAIGVVIATVLSGLGSATAMSMIGQAASGIIMEDPGKFGQTLVLQAMGSTNGIYGLLIGFLILTKTMTVTDMQTGLFLLASSLPVGIVGYIAALVQGKVLASGVILIGKRDGELAKPMIYAAMIETFAVFALLISFLMYNSV